MIPFEWDILFSSKFYVENVLLLKTETNRFAEIWFGSLEMAKILLPFYTRVLEKFNAIETKALQIFPINAIISEYESSVYAFDKIDGFPADDFVCLLNSISACLFIWLQFIHEFN